MSQHPFHARKRRRPLGGLAVLLLIFLVFPTAPAQAAWSHGDWTEVFTSTTEIHDFAVASDGVDGTLVMYQNKENTPTRSIISRLSRTGSELWGDEGKWVPFNMSSTNQVFPIDIAPDGSGGAYCVWSEWYTVSAVLRLGRFDENGNSIWLVDVASMDSNPGTASAQLVLEPGLGVTVGYVGSSTRYLSASRYDPDGTLVWTTRVNQFYEHNIQLGPGGPYTEYDMQPDGQGGVLFAWYRYDLLEYQTYGTYSEQIGAQRIDSNGTALWGTDGHQVWSQSTFWHSRAYNARIVDDGAGGAYVVTSGGLRAYGQHLDSGGNETWASNGIMLQAASGTEWDLGTDPRICHDGSGGMYLIQTNDHVFAQRVDINGSFPWGAAGIIAADVSSTSENFSVARLDEDGYGGAVVGFHRWDNGAESLGGLRFDGFGTVLWKNEQLFNATGSDEIQDIHVVSDGRGGAQYVWKRHVPDAPKKDDIYALGVNTQGQAPEPILYGLSPDAAEPGDVIPVLLFGDYLDDTYGYDLRHDSASVPMTGVAAFNSGLIGGWLAFTGAPIGAWDLYATLGGTDHASLANAFGVGLRPSCTAEEALLTDTTAENFGTRRKMSFDSAGNCRFGVMVYDSIGDEMVVLRGLNDMSATSLQVLESSPGSTATGLAYTVDPLDRDVVAYLRHDSGIDYLIVHTFDEYGTLVSSVSYDIPFTPELANPVVAAMPDGSLHVLMEQGSYGAMMLEDVVIDETGSSLSTPTNAANAHAPDLTITPDGLAIVYVRNSWFPGVSDLCLQYFRNGVWEAPQVVTFALDLHSPTVSSDGDSGLLLAWILDNSGNGSGPILQTCLVTNGVLGPIRTRATNGTILRVQADAQGPGNFYMLTQETGQPMQFFLRGGNGEVFYPQRRLNSIDDSDWPLFAAEHGGAGLGAMWQSYSDPVYGHQVMGWFCSEGVVTASPSATPTVLRSGVEAYPNPFNPRTTLAFSLSQDQWVQLDIIDLHGRRVRSVLNGPLPTGDQEVLFDGRDDQGSLLASGTYFARLRPALDAPAVVKLSLLK